MNRRKAIRNFLYAGAGGFFAYSGFQSYKLFKNPDIDLLKKHRALIAELAETIIPKTDTPGAKEAGVGDFIIKMIRDCTIRQSQNNFIDGLNHLADHTDKIYQKPFDRCSSEERVAILSYYENKGAAYSGMIGKVERKVVGDSFFTTLKKLTVLGYCSSEAGATMGLSYDYIPGSYIGKLPLRTAQKAWATQ